jgi:putative sterol carrier protein
VALGKIRSVRTARRRLADRKAEMLSRWVKAASDERLESVMRSPVRRLLLWQIFKTMRQRVSADNGWGGDAVVELRIRRYPSGLDRYQVIIADRRCRTTRSANLTPTVTLDLQPVAFLRLVGGASNVYVLILRGRLRVSGDLLLAARLPTLLNIPRRASRPSK